MMLYNIFPFAQVHFYIFQGALKYFHIRFSHFLVTLFWNILSSLLLYSLFSRYKMNISVRYLINYVIYIYIYIFAYFLFTWSVCTKSGILKFPATGIFLSMFFFCMSYDFCFINVLLNYLVNRIHNCYIFIVNCDFIKLCHGSGRYIVLFNPSLPVPSP